MRLLTRMRMEARMTRGQLADRSGIKPRTLRALESDPPRVPSDETLFALADVFDVDPIDLRRRFEREQDDHEREGAAA